jgi:hypothetical protein
MSSVIDKKVSVPSLISNLSPQPLWKSIKNIFSYKEEKPPKTKNVEICVVDESIYTGSFRNIYNTNTITIIYDRDNLDSLYGLAFFEFLYSGLVQAIPYEQSISSVIEIKPSHETIILGVDIACKDLVYLNTLTKSVRIFGYRGTFNYLYEVETKKLFNEVTLFQADNDFFIGGKGVEKLENTMAMMLKILYTKSDDWAAWNLSQYAISVAHETCFNENIPVYGLYKSTIEVAEKLVFEGIILSKNKAIIKNKENMLMHDLCAKLEDCVDRENSDFSGIKPVVNESDYYVYRKRLQSHITRTRKVQGWIGKDFFGAEKHLAHCIPAIGFAVHDLIALSSNNATTTVCIEDMGDRTVYYIYSKIKGKATAVAKVLAGDKTWIEGHMVVTSKLKNIHDRR